MDARAAARRWRDVWVRSWPDKDADAVVSVYAEHAAFRSQPFRDEHVGAAGVREYVEWAFSEQDSADVWFGRPFVDGDRATCEYWAVISFEGRVETIAGISVLQFDADGLVTEQRDYWNLLEGRRAPPEGWGG